MTAPAAPRYGNRSFASMYSGINELRQAIRARVKTPHRATPPPAPC